VAAQDGYANACGRHGKIVAVQDLLRLDDHLPLFLGRSVAEEHVDLRDAVEGDAVCEVLDVQLLAHQEVARLRVEFLHRRRAGA